MIEEKVEAFVKEANAEFGDESSKINIGIAEGRDIASVLDIDAISQRIPDEGVSRSHPYQKGHDQQPRQSSFHFRFPVATGLISVIK